MSFYDYFGMALTFMIGLFVSGLIITLLLWCFDFSLEAIERIKEKINK